LSHCVSEPRLLIASSEKPGELWRDLSFETTIREASGERHTERKRERRGEERRGEERRGEERRGEERRGEERRGEERREEERTEDKPDAHLACRLEHLGKLLNRLQFTTIERFAENTERVFGLYEESCRVNLIQVLEDFQ
jgi:hypothetical protein